MTLLVGLLLLTVNFVEHKISAARMRSFVKWQKPLWGVAQGFVVAASLVLGAKHTATALGIPLHHTEKHFMSVVAKMWTSMGGANDLVKSIFFGGLIFLNVSRASQARHISFHSFSYFALE